MRGYNTFANRGRDFEDFVIQVNDLYTRSGKAVVYKVPTEFLPIRDSTGQTWTPPPMASAAPEDFLPAWEVHLGGRTGLPYLETIEKLEGVLE